MLEETALRIFLPNGVIRDQEKMKLENLFKKFVEERGDLKVVVLSIAGNSRQGKSFLMNFFIRYVNLVFLLRVLEFHRMSVGRNLNHCS